MVQVNNTPITLRVKFFKKGNLQYISHLDLVRTMMKIIVRSKLPLWYTEGFNPKPKINFAAPLSTGVESECEFMDIRLTERMSPEDAKLRLNENMTSEMQVIDAYYPEEKMTALEWLGYSIRINCLGVSDSLAASCRNVLSRPELPILKKTKSGEAIVDIKPLIKSAEVFLDGGELCLNVILSANQSAFLNPEYVVKLLRSECGILSCEDLTREYYSIMRTDAYRIDMTRFK